MSIDVEVHETPLTDFNPDVRNNFYHYYVDFPSRCDERAKQVPVKMQYTCTQKR